MWQILYYMASNTFARYIILMMALHNVTCRQNWNHTSRSKESENVSKSLQFYYNQNIPYGLIEKKEYTHYVFLSNNKKVIGVWKSGVGLMEKAEGKQFRPWNALLVY